MVRDPKPSSAPDGESGDMRSGLRNLADGSLIRTHSNPTTYVIVGGARIRADDMVVSKRGDGVTVVADPELAALSVIPADDVVLREANSMAVWMMASGRRLLVPSDEALRALAGPDSQPQIVAPGSLEHLPATILPSGSITPPSMIFPPAKARYWAPPIAKFWPRTEMPGTTLPNGARVVPIRGWISTLVDWTESNISDPDVHLGIEPDPTWFDQMGFDWHTVFTVGDILSCASSILSNACCYVARGPTYKIELNGWLYFEAENGNWPGAYQGTTKPSDWNTKLPLSDGTRTYDVADFPFDPTLATGPTRRLLQKNDHVEISGSLVTDTPHTADMNYSQIAAWDRGYGNTAEEVAENAPGRHTEIHPPDSIYYLDADSVDPSDERSEYIYGVVLVTPINALDPLPSAADVTVDLVPPGDRPTLHHRAKSVEYVGPETNVTTIAHGNGDRTGAQMTEADTHITISVGVSGGPFATPTGKFKAIYRVWWFDDPTTYGLQVKVSPAAATLPYHSPTTLTVEASDQVTGEPVPANILMSGTEIGRTGAPVTVTLIPATKRVWIPPRRREPGGPLTPGYWEEIEEPVPLTVHVADSPLYPDVTVRLGSPVVIDDGD